MTSTQSSGLPAVPVEAYRVQRYYANGAVVCPLPCKSFTTEEADQIAAWFVAAGWETVKCSASGVKAVNSIGMTADDVPEPYTAAQRRRDELRHDRAAKEAAKAIAWQQCLTKTDAGRFVASTFGDTLNGFNSTALAKYLDGSTAKFEGLFTHRAADILSGLGINTSFTLEALVQLKARFETAIAVES